MSSLNASANPVTSTVSAPERHKEKRLITNVAIVKYSLIATDIIAFLTAGFLANLFHWLYLGTPPNEFMRIWTGVSAELRISLFATLVAVGIGWFWINGHYTRRRPFWDEVAEAVKILSVLAVLDASLLYLAKLQFSRFWFLGMWLFALALIPAARQLAKRLLDKLGVWQRPALVLGTSQNAIEAVEALNSEPGMGFAVKAFLHPREADGAHHSYIDVRGRRYPVVSLRESPAVTLARFDNPAIIVALEQEDLSREANLVGRLHRYCDDLRIVPPVRGLPLFGATVHHFFRHELFFLTLRNNLARRAPRALKRAFDLVISALLLFLFCPVFAYFAWSIKKDGGPAFFFHNRIGRGGKAFRCMKFRSMMPDAQAVLERLLASDPAARAAWEKDFKLKNDPRITAIGKFLREYSLDELPQLWNVLTGQMSLVGPRPIVEGERERYDESIDFYLETKPGMTGLWQISGRNNADYSYRVYLDAWYVKNWSLWYDIVILLKTVRVVLDRDGAY